MTRWRMSNLQRLIDKCQKANEKFYYAQAELNKFCEGRYGVAPSDIDCDVIIDSLLGGCGAGNGMTAKQFDAEMKAAMELLSDGEE